MILSRNLPYEMIVTYLLRYFKIDISGETACPPSIDIDRTLGCNPALVLMSAPPVQLPPQFASRYSPSFADPYSALMNQMTTMSLRQSEDTTKILANQEELRNTLA